MFCTFAKQNDKNMTKETQNTILAEIILYDFRQSEQYGMKPQPNDDDDDYEDEYTDSY